MAETTIKTRLKLRTKTSDEWEAIKDTDIPLEGEYCFVSDLNKSKIGDGTSTFYNLPWHNVTPEELEEMKLQVEESALYSTTVPTVNAFGGIPAGWTTDGMTVSAVLDLLLHPWVAPVVSTSTSPNGGVREKGNAITINKATVGITVKSSSITKVEVCSSQAANTPIATLTDGVSNGGTLTLTFDDIVLSSVNTYFIAKVTDAAGEVTTKNTGTFTFVYPYYYGAVDTAAPDASTVAALTKKVEAKGTKTYAFTCNNQRACFAYPASYGNIAQILDTNGFNVTDTFTKTTVSITGLDGTAQSYNVYTANTASTISAFNFKFSY